MAVGAWEEPRTAATFLDGLDDLGRPAAIQKTRMAIGFWTGWTGLYFQKKKIEHKGSMSYAIYAYAVAMVTRVEKI
jgi:hypothetical protein